MKLRSLFKVRRPGNGDSVQKGFEADARAKVSIATKSGTPNGGEKKGVK